MCSNRDSGAIVNEITPSGVEIGNVGALVRWYGARRPPRLGQRRRKEVVFSKLRA